MITDAKLLFRIRAFIMFFMGALALSGITAFPAETELHWVLQHNWLIPASLLVFVNEAYTGLAQTNKAYPMLAYGYDWLAFAHLVIAMMFIGPLRDPVRNKWVIYWAILACIAIFPLAFIAGPIRTIPFYWRLIDCSFGVIGVIPLLLVRGWIGKLEGVVQSS